MTLLAPLRNLPIRHKLIVVIMVTSGASLLVASLALIAADLSRSRDQLERDMESVAAIIAENSTAALSFDDPDAATETLEALSARPHIILACVYNRGRGFARYGRAPENLACPETAADDQTRWTPASMNLFKGINLEGKRIGTVYLQSDLGETYERMRLQIGTLAAVLAVSALVAFLLSSKLQGFISQPVLHLLQTTQAVSRQSNYSIRAVRQADDELGQLVDSFNLMLVQIEERESRLQLAKDELEERVNERTEQLRHELAERRRAEEELVKLNVELQQSNKELDDFAYIASHDLKEPLRGIHSYSVFLLEDYGDKFDAEATARLETLKRLSQRMESLIDTLLHYSRVGRTDLVYESVDLNDIVTDVKESLAVRLKETGAEVRVPVPLPKVQADRTRIGEVFYNLISNAVKYNDKPVKWVEVGMVDRDTAEAVFYVRDNGIGIPAKHLEAIFRIFKRLHARDKYGGGTGAGLTIVRKIVERHNGRVWVESTEGQGTTFYFTLNSTGLSND